MKLLALLALPAVLSGCVAYPVHHAGPVHPAPVYHGGGPYVVGPPAVVVQRPHHHYHHGRRDQDRDGVPNRYDRDRDGDGVPNRHDARPHNPRRW